MFANFSALVLKGLKITKFSILIILRNKEVKRYCTSLMLTYFQLKEFANTKIIRDCSATKK